VALAAETLGREPSYTVLGKSMLWAMGLVSRPARELRELLPRYAYDNLFDSSKFKGSFPDFRLTTYRDGIFQIFTESLPPNY
jgi:hypothetical protein